MKKHQLNQQTKEWHLLRYGCITGTVLSDILGTPKARESCLAEIISERMTPDIDMEYLHESALQRGIRLEPYARMAFTYVTGKEIEEVGFCQSEQYPWIGYSTDGIVKDSDDTADIEIKCCEGKNYIKIVMSNEVPKEYHWQIVQGFVVNPKLQIRYFVAYNPDIADYPIHIIECKRENYEEDIAIAMDKQLQFLADVELKLAEIKSNQS